MQGQEIPVAIHRWYSDKEGWAFHPSLSVSILDLARALKQELTALEDGDFVKPWQHGWLAGERALDSNCPNENARERRPTIFRVAALPHEPKGRDRDRILEELRRVPLPQQKGAVEGLAVLYEPPPVRPVWPPVARGWLSRLFSSARDSHPSQPEAEHIARELEAFWRYALDEGSKELLGAILSQEWRGVAASGETTKCADPAQFPALESFEVVACGGLLTLLGEAPVGGQPACCVHVYAYRRQVGAYEMVLATVTLKPIMAAHPASSSAGEPAVLGRPGGG